MNVAFEPKSIISVKFIPCDPESSAWNLNAKIQNTYKLLKEKGAIHDIFKDVDPYYHNFPTFIVNIAIVKNPEICKKALAYYREDQDEGGIFIKGKSPLTQFFKTVFPEINTNENILTCPKKNASKYHSFLVSYFSSRKINSQIELIQIEVNETLDRWKNRNCIDLSKETKIFTASIIGKLFIGYDGSYEKLTNAIDEVILNMGIDSLLNKFKRYIMVWKLIWDPEYVEKEKRLNEAVLIINEAIRTTLHNNEISESSLINEMCKKVNMDGSRVFSDNEIISMIFTLFFAGQDTTANLLNYILMELAKNKGLQDDIYNERISVQHLLYEGIRMFTPASLIGRQTKDDMHLEVKFDDDTQSTWFIPKNTLFTLAPTLMARDPNVVPDDDLSFFNPYRWDNLEAPKTIQKLSWLPFGDGVHRCPGFNLAEQEIILFINTIVQNFRLQDVGIGELKQRTNFVNKMYGDLRIKLIPR